jgi:hypothetical protein
MSPGEKSYHQKTKTQKFTTKKNPSIKAFRLAYLFLKNANYLKIGRTVSTSSLRVVYRYRGSLPHTKSEVELKPYSLNSRPLCPKDRPLSPPGIRGDHLQTKQTINSPSSSDNTNKILKKNPPSSDNTNKIIKKKSSIFRQHEQIFKKILHLQTI